MIWDSGGYNVLDLSGFVASSSGYRLDLNSLGWLSTNANYLTTYLMAGAVIGPGVSIQAHHQLGQQRHDLANADSNVFAGYAIGRVTGADVIHGATPTDTVDLSGIHRVKSFRLLRVTICCSASVRTAACGSLTTMRVPTTSRPSCTTRSRPA